MPEFILKFKMRVREEIGSVPKIRQKIRIESFKHNEVTFTVAFRSIVNVYAVIRKNTTAALTSSQVINGLDENNKAVISQHFKKVVNYGKRGEARIIFNLLDDFSNYTISVSADDNMPFKPRLALDDSQVMTATFTTRINPNVMKNADQVAT